MPHFPIRAVRALAFVVALGSAGLAAAQGPSTSPGQAFPTKPVRVVVPFGPGGVADITARIVAQRLSERLGQQVVVENRPGAGGIAAAQEVLRSEPDGHTLFLISNGTAVSVSLFKSLPYDPVKDFEPVSTLGFFALLVLVNGDSKIGSVQELVAAAKANPGKLNFGTINIGSSQHLGAELFRSQAGLNATVVPFKTSGAVITALRANDVQAAFEFIGPAMPQIKAGAVKALAVTSDRRFEGLPDVPTVIESGLPNYNVASWNGLAAPARTPRPAVERLGREVNAVVALPDVKQKLLDLGIVARAGAPEDLRRLLADEIAKWSGVVAKANIEKQ